MQVADMIYDHFRATGAYDAAQGLSDLFNICLHEDDIQDFDTRWDQALLTASEIPPEMVCTFGMLDAMIASAEKRLLDKHIHFRKRVSIEEQRAQKHDRFLRGRQNANMICEHFRATGACEAVQGLSNLFSVTLQNDDVQDFDVRWDQALLSASDMPSDVILEGLYKSKLQDSVQFQTVLALYDHQPFEPTNHQATPD